MKIILTGSIKKLGGVGSVVSVKGGFGRYLVNSGIALRASKGNMEKIEKGKDALYSENAKLLQDSASASGDIAGKVFTFIRIAGADGRLFGSVSKRDIATCISKALNETETKFELDHGHVLLEKPIKEVGCYNVAICLHHEIPSVKVIVNVAQSEEIGLIALEKFLATKEASKEQEEHREVFSKKAGNKR